MKDNVFVGIIVGLIIFLIGLCVGVYSVNDKIEEQAQQFEHKIDSIKENNVKIILEVEHLDSIKNEKIIKVKELDNDSTLKLFYELLGK